MLLLHTVLRRKLCFSRAAFHVSRSFSTAPPTTPSSFVRSRDLTPRQMVDYLDQHIIGQSQAKRAVSIAVRQRWRRRQIQDPEMREDIVPKNILMVGPTGVGKTEVARRLAKLTDAPFIKVEATKFTEVGFQGRDVDQIIRDLVDIAIKDIQIRLESKFNQEVQPEVHETIIDNLTGLPRGHPERAAWLQLLQDGKLNQHKINVTNPIILNATNPTASAAAATFSNQNQPNTTTQYGAAKVFRVKTDHTGTILTSPSGSTGSSSSSSPSDDNNSISVGEALKKLTAIEVAKRIAGTDVVAEAIKAVEEDGIVFIDEIDKIVTKQGKSSSSPDASAEGVQRDLLPIVEGTSISTKHGNVKTDHILFIAAGAFASVKPSDMLSELQGRFPVRVELQPLGRHELRRILVEPKNNLIRQQMALFETEGVYLDVDMGTIEEMANVAYDVNTMVDNIGARRLGTIVEKLVEKHSFELPEMESGSAVKIEKHDVEEIAQELLKKSDLKKFIL